MYDYNVGDEVEMLVNGKVVDRGVVREVIKNAQVGATIAKIEWKAGGLHSQWIGELRKKGTGSVKTGPEIHRA
jgi:hypothetical protein